MTTIRDCGVTLIGVILLFGVHLVDCTFSCYKCSSDKQGENCGIELINKTPCFPSDTYSHCLTYQYQFNDSTITVRDCANKTYNCKTLYSNGKNDSLLMCNECNNIKCNKNIDTTNTCVKCNSLDNKDCGDEIKEIGNNTCFLDQTVNTKCITYKYKEDSAIVTVRDCGNKNTCATLYSGEYNETLQMCDECTNSNSKNCNSKIHISKTCVQCNSLEHPGCENATIDTSALTDTCNLDDTVNTECITYKYTASNTTVTIRGCAPSDTCNSLLTDTYQQVLVMCHSCTANKCNQNLDDLKTCIECNSLENSKCNQKTIETTSMDVCYLDNVVNDECITYKYKESASSSVTIRGCASKTRNNCTNLYSKVYPKSLLMCDECNDNNGNNCNKDIDTSKTCIECNSQDNPECRENTTISNTCFLDKTVNTECITYKIHNEKNQNVIFKGCAPKNYCSKLSKSYNSSLLMCDECSNKNDCNQEIVTSKTCIECNSLDQPGCKNNTIDMSVINSTCYLDDTVNQECITYKYQKDNVTSVVVRGCAPKKNCASLSNTNELLYCYECDNLVNCNKKIDSDKTCVKCNSIDDRNCDDSATKVTESCFLDETVNTECITYKYRKDVDTQVTVRDCAPKNYCETIHNNSLIMCNECTGKECNKNIDTTKSCIQCNSLNNSDCDDGSVNPRIVKDRCYLDDTVNTQCVAYKYFQDGKSYTYRGCSSKNFCENAWTNTTACETCTGDTCNAKSHLNPQKTLCIQCTSENDNECSKDDMNSSRIKEYCALDNTTECVAYKSLNLTTGEIHTYRGCAPKNYCASLSVETNKMTVCNECTSSNICNKKIDTSSEVTLCVECIGEEGSECAADTVNLTQVEFCKIDKEKDKKCVAYRYFNNTTGKIITKRSCESTDYCLTNNNKNNTAICTECQGEACNKNINVTSEKSFCVKCDGAEGTECAKDTITDLTKVEFCIIGSTDELKCASYRYLDVTSGKIQTHRGCESIDYCNQTKNNKTTILCTDCKANNEYCNMNINVNDEKTLCVKCDSKNEPECGKDSVDLSQIDFCKISSSENQQCVTYRYLDVTTGNISTSRGCETTNYCSQYNSSETTIICSECKNGDHCNKDIDPMIEETLCVSCNGEECADDTANLTKVGFCKIGSADKKRCVSYKYLDVKSGNINTYRGCELENYCDEHNKEDTTIICSDCKDKNYCNIKIDTEKEKTLCVSCTGEEGSECASDKVNLANVSFCGFTSTENKQCASYRYLNVTSGRINTYRNCVPENYCNNTNNETTLLCSECKNSDHCNMIIDRNMEDGLCVQCNGNAGSECAENIIRNWTKVDFCKINSRNQLQCAAYRYVNDTSGEIITSRGCERKNYCDQYSDSETAILYCNECNDNNNCNADIDESIEKTLCVKCTGEEGTECANDVIEDSTKVDFCTINVRDNEQCVTYKYLNVSTGKMNIYRGCETENYCTQRYSNETTAVCKNCNNCNKCNNHIDQNGELTLCVKCMGKEGSECAADTVTNLTNVGFCGVDDKQKTECIAYRYLKESTNELITVRNCTTIENMNCQKLSVEDGQVQQCLECNHDEICNNYLPTVSSTEQPIITSTKNYTSGVSSIVQYKFNVTFLFLIIGSLLLLN